MVANVHLMYKILKVMVQKCKYRVYKVGTKYEVAHVKLQIKKIIPY